MYVTEVGRGYALQTGPNKGHKNAGGLKSVQNLLCEE